MIDIIGNIKISETADECIDERLNYLLKVIDSFSYLSDNSKFYLNVENSEYIDFIEKGLIKNNFDFELTNDRKYFGDIYMNFVNKSDKDYFQHFEEDHISVCKDITYLEYILEKCLLYNVDLIKTTFFEIENKSYFNINSVYEDDLCKIIKMDINNFTIVNKLWARYYIGNNSIFNKNFAFKYWGRKFETYPPHKYEISKFDKNFEHILMIPKKEILCAINDDHGLPNSCYLKKYGKLKK